MTDVSNSVMPLPVVQVDSSSSTKRVVTSEGHQLTSTSTYNHSNRRNNRNNYHNGGGRFHNNQNYHYQMNGMYGNRGYPYHHAAYEIDPQMREYYNHMAVQQIELLYSIDCLCMDTYFRSFMDEAGYSPLFFVASYPNVACYGATLADIMTKISTKEDSPLEIDQENETIRLKEGWEKWLMPNDTGGMGVPRYYLKEQYIQSTQSMQQMSINASDNNIFRSNNQNQNRTQRGTAMKMHSNVTGTSCMMSTSPTTVQMTEENSSCRDSTSGESRDSDDAFALPTPEGSVTGGDGHPFESMEGSSLHQYEAKIARRQQQQEQRHEEEDREQKKQNAERLCPAPITVVASPTSVAGLGWANVLKKNLDVVPNVIVPAVKKITTNVKTSKQPKQSPASTAQASQRKQVTPIVPSATTAVPTVPPSEITEKVMKEIIVPVAGKISWAAIAAAAADTPSTATTTK